MILTMSKYWGNIFLAVELEAQYDANERSAAEAYVVSLAESSKAHGPRASDNHGFMASLYNSLMGSIDAISSAFGGPQHNVCAEDFRDLYPRTAWHDVQASVRGPAAIDVSSHFVTVS
jgi:hypothetical protein